MSAYTEEVAKAKWCPHARTLVWEDFRDGEKVATANRYRAAPDAGCMCIASGCMAWRWANEQRGKPREGYCGLGGRP